MLRLHYVPGGHGNHDFGHCGQNGLTVTHRRGTWSTNVASSGCRGRDDTGRFFSKKIATAAMAGLTYLFVPYQNGENATKRDIM